MKRVAFLFLVFCMALPQRVFGRPLDTDEARKLARNFFAEMTMHRGTVDTFMMVYPRAKWVSRASVYIFNACTSWGYPYGYVMVCGESNLPSILGYSFSSGFYSSRKWRALDEWVKWYEQQISAYQRGVAFRVPQHKKDKEHNRMVVKPLLDYVTGGPIAYGQGEPYNILCPEIDTLHHHAPTGCVATAVAQIMCYYRYPDSATGRIYYKSRKRKAIMSTNLNRTEYNWSRILNAYPKYDRRGLWVSYSMEIEDEIARLLRDVGYACQMEYHKKGSGASMPEALTALRINFGYNPLMDHVQRARYKDSKWLQMVKDELDAGRPVLYSYGMKGRRAGHAFVCDGYTSGNFFHMNWGWDGAINGWFRLESLVYELVRDQNKITNRMMQDMVRGIKPAVEKKSEEDEERDNNALVENGFGRMRPE